MTYKYQIIDNRDSKGGCFHFLPIGGWVKIREYNGVCFNVVTGNNRSQWVLPKHLSSLYVYYTDSGKMVFL